MQNNSEIDSQNLKRHRRSRGLRQGDIAALLGISREAISKVETGKRELSGAETKLLEWYFYGRIPVSIQRPVETGAVTFSFR